MSPNKYEGKLSILSYNIIRKYMKLELFIVLMGSLLWTSIPTVSASTRMNDNLALTKSLKATKVAIEKAAKVALATNMISEVAVEYTVNTYPAGQCTWGAKQMAPWVGNYWGNGGDWAATAKSLGYEVGSKPKAGAIAVWTDGGYGHVAYVTDVAKDGRIQVKESNYSGAYHPSNVRGFFDPTATSEGTVSYIYPPVGV